MNTRYESLLAKLNTQQFDSDVAESIAMNLSDISGETTMKCGSCARLMTKYSSKYSSFKDKNGEYLCTDCCPISDNED